MRIILDAEEAYAEELRELCKAENTTAAEMALKLVLQRVQIFLHGKMVGQKRAHEQAMKTIENIGKKSR